MTVCSPANTDCLCICDRLLHCRLSAGGPMTPGTSSSGPLLALRQASPSLLHAHTHNCFRVLLICTAG